MHEPRIHQAPAVWTGRLEFELTEGPEWRFGHIEFVLRLDLISVWWTTRSLAVVDRQQFRNWIRCGAGPLTQDDVTFYASGDNLALRVGRGPVLPVPDAVTARLRAVV